MSTPRQKSREQALQILYQLSLNEALSTDRAFEYFEENFTTGEAKHTDEFAQRLVLGVNENAAFLDKTIVSNSRNWKMERMTTIDRTLLRLGVFELHYCDDIPATVTINEMVELAKRFGSEESSSFINGILDAVAKELDRPEKAP